MTGKRRYLCRACQHATKWIDRSAPDTIRTGCSHCNAIKEHVAYGTVAFHIRMRDSRGGHV